MQDLPLTAQVAALTALLDRFMSAYLGALDRAVPLYKPAMLYALQVFLI